MSEDIPETLTSLHSPEPELLTSKAASETGLWLYQLSAPPLTPCSGLNCLRKGCRDEAQCK